MRNFVNDNSIVRQIWGKADTVLFIFAGAAAEFALNKAVDWLYFTGRLPADPIGRLFSTVTYARRIVFADWDSAHKAIDQITRIHQKVEQSRGANIPDWAYRDVLFMLIHFSIAAYEVLERKLTEEEKEEVFDVFFRVGQGMHLKDLPQNYNQWLVARQQHLVANLERSHFTVHLLQQYKKHLGSFRYFLLLQVQALLSPPIVRNLLRLPSPLLGKTFVALYKISRVVNADGIIKNMLLPKDYKLQIKQLDQPAISLSYS
ncbi:MAG: oxygenase MpaB family protein [Chitinophagaceae bacterium]